MASFSLTGSRIREWRLDQGVRQADLAVAVGISPSYLNLIEHNRRRIAGKLLTDLARALNVEASLLTDGADAGLLDQMRKAALDVQSAVEMDRVDDIAARFPGWSELIATQSERIKALEEQVKVLLDRMSHDPALASSLHGVISAVTSIRSTASILVSGDAIDADWQRRFHKNIYDDSLRLTASSEALMGHLDSPDAGSQSAVASHNPLAAFLLAHDFHLAALEQSSDQAAVAALIEGEPTLQKPSIRPMALRVLTQYQSDAAAMPLARFGKDAAAMRYDPAQLSASYHVELSAVLRRLAALPPNGGHPPFGLVVCDGGGNVRLFKPVSGFEVAIESATCPLWPVFTALRQVGQPLRQLISLPVTPVSRALCYAVAQPITAPRFDGGAVVESTMLVLPNQPDGTDAVRLVGSSCRICPRENCEARGEASILDGGIAGFDISAVLGG